MSTRGLLVAAGLLLVMLGALSFLQKKTPGTERGKQESKRVTLLPVREADRIELTTAKGALVFQKPKDGEWQIAKPVETGADGTTVGQLLSEVQFVERMQTLPKEANTEVNRQTFGLGQPSRTLKVATPEGELSVEIGRETPIAGGIFARVRQPRRGEELVVVQNQLAEAMDKDLTAWREKRVFPLVIPEVEDFRLRQGATEVEIQKTAEGAWIIRKPVEAPADPGALNSVLGEVSALRATDFVADSKADPALYGLTAPAQSFEIRTKATNRILQIGQVNPQDTNQVFARMADRPFVFTLPRGALEQLGKLPERVRDRRLATFPAPSLIGQIEFGGRGGEYRLEKQGDGWVAAWGGKSRAADPARVDRWLDAVLNSRANRFLATEDPAKLGFAKPRVTATLSWPVPSTNGTTMKTETLSFGEETKDEVYVQNSAITGTMATTVALIRETPENAMGWLERRLLPKDFGSVRGLIWSSGGQRREYRAGEDGRWRAAGPEADIPEAAGYATRILDLEVIRWTGAPGKKEFGKPEVELVVEGEGNKRTQVTLGRPLADGTAPIRREGGEFAGLVTRQQVEWLKRDPGLSPSATPPAPSGR
ncbi:MAG: DUF4340 domain-containing protein [Verrucomicrobia bacterium]|nr:DUF4340 domain-containing protein [Verrucomicrobiota bacterium]